MTSITIFTIALTVIALQLAAKVKVGPALAVASLVVLVLSNKLKLAQNIITRLVTLKMFYWVLAVIAGVSILGSLLKHLNKIPLLVESLQSILKRKNLVIAALPAIIGALPMPGGAYLSAPMVEKAGKDTPLTKEKLTAINHWYRHLFEFFLPLYPGFILTVSLCHFTTFGFSLRTFPLAIAGAVTGALVLFRNEDMSPVEQIHEEHWKNLFSALWPVGLVLVPSLAGVPFLLSLYLSIGATAFIYKVKDRQLWKVWFNRAFNVNTVCMIGGIFLFKETIEMTKLSYSLAPELSQAGLPLTAVIVLVPLLAGLLAGIGVGFVGISYPVLLPLITLPSGETDMSLAVLIYASGWAGMMLSPAHLCLILTGEYFEAEMTIVYKYLIVMSIMLVLFALVLTYGYTAIL